jgi:ABC-type Co2+ transport system permease subunit
MMALGGLVFGLWGKRLAFMRTVLVALVLSLGVKLFAESWLPLANAALFGWLVALVIWVVFRVFTRIEKREGGVRYVEA